MAVVERAGVGGRELDRGAGAGAGERVALGSGHGPDVRMACVAAVDPADPRRLELDLDPGPRLQVGDRLHARPGRSDP